MYILHYDLYVILADGGDESVHTAHVRDYISRVIADSLRHFWRPLPTTAFELLALPVCRGDICTDRTQHWNAKYVRKSWPFSVGHAHKSLSVHLPF